MSNEKELQNKIKEFENKHGYVVYHAVHGFYEFGECWTFLYVSSDKNVWEEDKRDLRYECQFTYTWNVDDDTCSEFGSSGIRGVYGAVIRTA